MITYKVVALAHTRIQNACASIAVHYIQTGEGLSTASLPNILEKDSAYQAFTHTKWVPWFPQSFFGAYEKPVSRAIYTVSDQRDTSKTIRKIIKELHGIHRDAYRQLVLILKQQDPPWSHAIGILKQENSYQAYDLELKGVEWVDHWISGGIGKKFGQNLGNYVKEQYKENHIHQVILLVIVKII